MREPYRLVLATGNPGKVTELRALLDGVPVEVMAASDFTEGPQVVEDADTLEGNALKKARAWHRHTGLPTLADDTGLEVEVLGGQPGVHSARYAGEGATDADNRRKLLEALRDEDHRAAQFRTVVAFVAGRDVHTFEGICRGRITQSERGDKGFGYDSIFEPAGYEQTFAELSAGEKNRISHRGRALRKFQEFLPHHLDHI